MSGNKQSNLRSNSSLTILLLFSTTSQYHHYSRRHDDLDQYGTTTSSKLCSQGSMFNGATSFDQPLLYCNWQSKSETFTTSTNVCDGTVTCGWGNETCPTTALVPVGNGGGGKTAVICFLNCHYGALLILLNYYIIFDIH
jgi:hypothetical protein